MTVIPTKLALEISVLGRVGKGPADRANLIGAIVDKGYDFHHADAILDDTLGAMVDKARIERVEVPSSYVSGKSYAVWRLPASTPMASPAAVAVPVREGFISAADFRASGRRK